jgi:hypothetical protein
VKGLESSHYVLVLVSYGRNWYMVPSPHLQHLLKKFGAGAMEDDWSKYGGDPGSHGLEKIVESPVSYVLVGIGASPAGSAAETISHPWSGNIPPGSRAPLETNIFFYKESFSGSYTLGQG